MEKTFSRACVRERGVPIRAVVTDLDGTFLNSSHGVSQGNIAACRRLRDKHIACVFATGRPHVGTVKCIGPEKLEAMGMPDAYPGVYMNGCVVYGPTGDLLLAEYLDANLQKAAMQLLEERKLLNRLCGYNEQGIFCIEKNQHTWHTHDEYDEGAPFVVPSGDALKEMQFCKLTVNGNQTEVAEFRALLEDFAHKRNGRCVQPIPGNVELIPLTISKAKGLDILFASMHLRKEEAVALGDSENDLEMLRHIDLSVCVANGCKEAREAAKFVTVTNDQDGFALVCNEICDELEDKDVHAPRAAV